jgi:hypothetical protein
VLALLALIVLVRCAIDPWNHAAGIAALAAVVFRPRHVLVTRGARLRQI